MKTARVLAAFFVLVWQICPAALAADFYWDPDGTAAGNDIDGTSLGGNGIWDTSTSAWWDTTNNVAWPGGAGDNAIFTGPLVAGEPTQSTVTLSGLISANRLSFRRSRYHLTGGQLLLAGTMPSIDVSLGDYAIIDSEIQGSGGLTKTGRGTVRLGNNANTYTGTTTISSGSVVISGAGALGNDTSAVVVTGSPTRGFEGGALVLDGTAGGFTFSRDLSLQGYGPIGDRSSALLSLGDNTLSGLVTTATGSVNTRINQVNGTMTFAGGLNVEGTAGTTVSTLGGITQAGVSNYVFNSALTGTGTLEKSGGGTLFLAPTDTSGFSGSVRVSSSSTGTQSSVRINSANVLGTRTAAGTAGVIDLNGGILEVLMDAPSVQAGGVNANVYQRTSGTIFVDHGATGTAMNGTLTLGQLAFEENQTLTVAGRNGFGVTFGAAPVQGGNNNSTITNNLQGGGTLTFTGNFWSNTENGANRTLTIGGAGQTLISGNIIASAAAFNHNLTKAGTGTLTITSGAAATTLDGNVNVQDGRLTIANFQSINNAAAVVGRQLNLGNAATNGVLEINGANPTVANLELQRTLRLAGAAGGGTILANQSGANSILIANVATPTDTAKTLALGGVNTSDNTISGNLVDAAAGALSVTKIDGGTWLLSGTNTYTGATTISAGTLKLLANGAASTTLSDSSAIAFNAVNVNAGGTLEFVGQAATNNVETLGALTPTLGSGTVRLTPGAGGTASVVFSSLGAVGVGATVNFVAPTSSDTVSFSTIATTNNIADAGLYYNGADFAFVPGAGSAIRAANYGTDADFATSASALTAGQSNQITGSFSTAAIAIDSLKISGSHTLTQSGLLTVRTGAVANASGGIIQTGGNSVITGATGITTGGTGSLVIRVDGSGDTLTLNGPITSTTTGGFTKSGAGTLILAGANNQTGTISINEGTVRLSGTGRLGAGAALTIRQGAVLDLNGVTPGTSTNAFNNNGRVTNGSATAVTYTVGGANGTGTSTGIIENGTGVVNVTKAGTGGQNWNGLSTYTGTTTIGSTGIVSAATLANIGSASGIGAGNTGNNAGSLIFTGASAVQAFGGLSYTGATSTSTNRLFTFGGAALDSGARIQANGANQAAIVYSNTGALAFGTTNIAQGLVLGGASTGDNRFNPQITNNGTGIVSLFKADAGTWHLGNTNNNYTGLTTITAGTLGDGGGTTIPSNSPIVFNGGRLLSSGNFTRNLVATATAGNANEVSFLTGGGFAALDSQLVVSIGGLATPTALTWGAGGFASGTLNLSSGISVADVDFRNAIDLGAVNRTIDVFDNANTGADYVTLSGIVSGAGGGIIKTGTGILRLTGANTYTGATAVQAGTIVASSLGNSSAPGATSVGDSATGNTTAGQIILGTAATGGILQYVGAGETSDRLIFLGGATASNQIHADGAAPLILTNVVNGATGAATLFLRGTNTSANMITSALANGGAAFSVNVDGGATWILSNSANSYSGSTTVNGGALGLGEQGSIGTSTLVLGNGSTFAYGADRSFSNAVSQSNNTTTAFVGDNSLNLTGTLASLAAANNVTTTNTIIDGKTLTLNDATFNLITAARTWNINGDGDTIINGNITTSTAMNFALGLTYAGVGNGTLTLNGTGSNLNGGTVTINSGRLIIGADGVIPDGAGAGNLVIGPAVGATAMLDLNGHSETINGLTANGAGTTIIDNTSSSAATLRFGANDQAVSFGGGTGDYTITDSGSGALSIVKAGTGSAVIPSGVTLTYEGATTVEGGSLTIASPVDGTTSLNVLNSGSQLNLSGGIAAPTAINSVVVENGATLQLLDGVGNKLTNLTNLTLGSTGGTNTTLNFNVGDLSVAGDGLNTDTLTLLSGGTLSLFTGNNVTFNLSDSGLNANQTYNLLLSSSGFTSGALSSANYVLGATPGGFSSITLVANDDRVFLSTGNLITGTSYWRGLTDTTWNGNANNWSDDKDGLTPASSVPGQGTDVVFQWNSGSNAAVTTTLEQNFRVNSLTFEAADNPADTPASVTINPGTLATNRLEIAPQSASDGIKITAGGPVTATISGPVRLGANQSWEVVDTGSTLSLGSLQGEADVTKIGAGRVVLSAAADATFNSGVTADITVNAGTLELTNAAALGNTINSNLANVIVNSSGVFYYNNATAGNVANSLNLNGGTLSAAGAAQTYSGLVNVSANSVVNLRNANSATTNTTQRNITLSGPISGSGRLLLDSIDTLSAGNQLTGELILSGNNSAWSGGLDIVRGTVRATNLNAFGTNSITAQSGRIIFNTGNGTTFNSMSNLTIDSPGGILELNVDNSAGTPSADLTANFGGSITLGGTNANNALRLFQANDNFSKLNIRGGIVLGSDASVSISGSTINRAVTIDTVGISETGGPRVLTLNDDLGGWAQTNRPLEINVASTYTGGTRIAEGVVILGNAAALGTGAITITGASTLQAGVDLSAGGVGPVANALTLNANLITSGTNNLTIAGTFTGTGPAANRTLTNNIAAPSALVFSGQTNLADAADIAPRTLTIAGTGATHFTGVVTDGNATANNITKTSSGILSFSNTNSYSGTTTISAGVTAGIGNNYGVIVAAANNALGVGAVNARFNTGAVTSQVVLTGGITLGNSSFTTTGAGSDGTTNGIIRSVSGANTITGDLNMVGGGGSSTYRADGGSSLTFSGTVGSIANATRIINLVGAGDFVFTGLIRDSNQATPNAADFVGFDSSNSGTTTVSGTNTYTGATSVGANNTFIAGSTQAFGINSATSVAGTLRLAGNSNSIGSLAGAGIVENMNAAAALLTTGGNNTSTTFTGIIQDGAGGGALSLTKTGTGTFAVSGANTYSGGTTVDGGVLLVNNLVGSGTGSGPVTVASGAVLGGSGVLDGVVTFQSGAVHNPGNSPGVQTFANDIDYSAGSVFTWELITNTELLRGANFDGVDLTGAASTLTFAPSGVTSNLVFNSAGSNVLWADSFWDIDRQWLVFDNAGTTSNLFDTINVGNDSGGNTLLATRGGFSWSNSSNDVYLNFTAVAVPEPATLGLIGIAGLGLIARRRSRSKPLV